MHCQPRYKGPVYIWLKNNQACLLCDEPSDSALALCAPCLDELPCSAPSVQSAPCPCLGPASPVASACKSRRRFSG